MVQNIRNINKT